jgi:hypothetical protein
MITFSIGRLLSGNLDVGYSLAHFRYLSTEVIVRQPYKYRASFFLMTGHQDAAKRPAEELFKWKRKRPSLGPPVKSYPGATICE